MSKKVKLMSNIVPKKALRKSQLSTLDHLSRVVANSAGPYGSNSSLVHEKRFSEYSKDGLTILQNIKYPNILEENIKNEMIELARHIKATVGDGSSSLTILSNLIFQGLCKMEEEHPEYSPFMITRIFRDVVSKITDKIRENGRECTLEDIYKIAMISTNGNEDIATAIYEIYKENNMNVYINVGTSNTEQHMTVTYDGMTLDTGYSDTAFINDKSTGKCVIKNPRIYTFTDPVDTPEMISFFDKIIHDNIMKPYQDNDLSSLVPTVILCHNISRDLSSSLKALIEFLYKMSSSGFDDQKPPILIINNIPFNSYTFEDIATLSGCPAIHKYINKEVQEEDIANGKAPTLENITEWCGHADEVISDALSSQFVNPEMMYNHDDNGKRVGESGEGYVYRSLVDYLHKELDNATINATDDITIGKLKKRLHSLESNVVDYLIGGINVVDRDCDKILAKDAVFNCRSAVENNVGYGCNIEGFLATLDLLKGNEFLKEETDEVKKEIKCKVLCLISAAYKQLILSLLQTTGRSEEEVSNMYKNIKNERKPIDLLTGEISDSVLSTIESDAVVLESIAKIITVMFSANQAMLPDVMANVYDVYLDDEEK